MSYFEDGKLKYNAELAKAVPEFIISQGNALCEKIVVGFLSLPDLRVNSELKINGEMYIVTGRIDNRDDNQSVIYVSLKESPPECDETDQACAT